MSPFCELPPTASLAPGAIGALPLPCIGCWSYGIWGRFAPPFMFGMPCMLPASFGFDMFGGMFIGISGAPFMFGMFGMLIGG